MSLISEPSLSRMWVGPALRSWLGHIDLYEFNNKQLYISDIYINSIRNNLRIQLITEGLMIVKKGKPRWLPARLTLPVWQPDR